MSRKADLVRRARNGKPLEQVAALPWRRKGGQVEVLLITSRRTRRLILPKGWPMRRYSNADAAAIEALEEAGVAGTVKRKAIGQYTDIKVFPDCEAPVRVSVFPLRVRTQLRDWKEASERCRFWMPQRDACGAVQNPELSDLLARL